ncbi:MAG: phage terminase large subunit, partial [Clostridia bacterium]|nr:phage terminase large subunit [Clostridia bacterium]
MTAIEKYLLTVKPYPKQEEFFKASTTRIAYGGARGGGKSWAMRTKFILLALSKKGIQILLLRRTFPELRENHIIPLQKSLNKIATYKESTKEFIFKNGSRIKLGYCQNEGDILQYQGQAYEVIGLEEATQFTYMQYIALTESNRLSGNVRDFTPRMYFTCNPGGVGHEWVKRLFIDKSYTENENAGDYTFVPSTVYDNEYLISKNPEYVKTLEALPPIRKKAMLYGDWDAFEGQYFPEFSREKHVCRPFEIPSDWSRFIAFDYGLDMTACLWFAFPPDRKRLYVYRELYRPNMILSEAAKEIVRLTGEEKIRFAVASPDLAGRRQDSGKTGFNLMASAGLVGVTPANNNRLAGWRMIRELLTLDDEGVPRILFFENCLNLIRTLPRLTFDERIPEDVSVCAFDT